MSSEVVIFGGGATGTATFRDLAMRGFSVALIEKRTIASGTTSASHQNLVGGLRYVIKDPVVAQECAEENRIISVIAPDVVGDLQNYFVGFSSEYTESALHAAKRLNIQANEVDINDVLSEIPSLNRDLDLAVETTDKNINAQRFCWLNCLSAKRNGGELFEGTEVHRITKTAEGFTIVTNHRVLQTKYIINATGPWINDLASKLNTTIPVTYSQGTIIVQKALSPRGIQHLRYPSDADAYIVHDGHGWLGTTSTTINTPDEAKPEPWADTYLKDEFSHILPRVKQQHTLRTFTGIRVLPITRRRRGEASFENGRQKSRDFKVVEEPDSVFHIIGGKLTTARLMAEKISDSICSKALRSTRCRTAREPLTPD